jgi:hypothetical protein
MTDFDFAEILVKSKKILNQISKGTLGDGGMGMAIEHQTSEGMGSIMPKKTKCKRALANDIEDEIGFKKYNVPTVENIPRTDLERYGDNVKLFMVDDKGHAQVKNPSFIYELPKHKRNELVQSYKKFRNDLKGNPSLGYNQNYQGNILVVNPDLKNIEPYNKDKHIGLTSELEVHPPTRAIFNRRSILKTFYMIEAMKNMDGGPVTQEGFGFTEDMPKKEKSSVLPTDVKSQTPFVRKPVQQKQILPEISNEVKLGKASYESVAGPYSYTDETSPKDDSFYLPTKLDGENNDTKKDAKKHKKSTEELESKYFGRYSENVGDQGKARAKQQYNTGAFENSQIGNQGV